MPISPRFLPSDLHYIIPLAEKYGNDAPISHFDSALGRHVLYGERLSEKDIQQLGHLYVEISVKGHGPLITGWHQSQGMDTCPPETTWPVHGLLCLFRQLGNLGIAPFNDGVVCPLSVESSSSTDESALEFEGPSFADPDLKALANLDKVEMLVLRDTAVTDDGCRELLRARALVEIAILSDKISDNALAFLAQLPALRSLQIHRGPKISDVGLCHLSGCVGLRELYLKETAITDYGLSAIAQLPHVWSLILDDTAVSDEGCAALADMPELGLLCLNRTRVVGHGLANLRDNKHFNITLEGTPATDEGVMAIAERISNLKLISLNQTIVGDRAARALSKLQRLNDVRFSHTRLTDTGLATFSGHPFLEVIYVEGCAVSNVAVSALKKSRRQLTVYGP